MKKLLFLMLAFGVTSAANAGLVELMIVSSGPNADSLSPIDPTSEITIAPSEWVAMDILYSAEPAWTLTNLSIDIVADGSATLDLTGLTEPPGAWDPFFTVLTENEAGKNYTLEYAMDNGVNGAGEGVPVAALNHILLHCDGDGQVTVTMADTGGTRETDWATSIVSPTFGGPVLITQVPEPVTIALLGLGSLFLLRRRSK